MIFKSVSTIKKDLSDTEFINLCKKSLYRTVAVCTVIISISILLWLGIILNYNNIEEAPITLSALGYFSTVPFLIAIMILMGNLSGGGMLIEYLECKSIKDWVKFAERQVWKSDGTILSKRLEVDNKEIIEVCLESKELRCLNLNTGNIEIIELNNTFKEKVTFVEKDSLADNELQLDLSKEDIIAYVNSNSLKQLC